RRELFERRKSIFDSTIRLSKRASHIILEVPVAQLRRINQIEGIGSIKRESQHFSDNTTLHGPKRIFHGKKCSFAFWIVMMITSVVLLFMQIATLIYMYVSHPTVSQVSFIMKEDGIDFPMITLCNYNPIRKTYINFTELNVTGDFSGDLLDYLLDFLIDASTLYGAADREILHIGDKALEIYQKAHPNFTVHDFFMKAGLDCEDIMMMCSFGGRRFDCCQYAHAILTNLGKCYTSGYHFLSIQHAIYLFLKPCRLQIVLDAHLEEQFDGTDEFINVFENGYRYYVHDPSTIPYLASEGVSVSPTMRVYSAISTNSYVLLPSERWGNCTSSWPPEFHSALPYSAVNCESICKANFFFSKCGCSPFTYDIENDFAMCSPFQTVRCIDDYIRKPTEGAESFEIPKCKSCQVECESVIYHTYNSYGYGFSNGALSWLSKKNSSWTKAHMKTNFLAINVFFRDMSYTEYVQLQGTTLTETLSDIGGNMGMFLGMSMITLVEVIMFFTKIVWITISKKRRDYMYRKKMLEKVNIFTILNLFNASFLFAPYYNFSRQETMNNLTSLQHKKDSAATNETPGPGARLRSFIRRKITPSDDGRVSPSATVRTFRFQL
uniref:Amiloride-sensitive sodium channel n=1 Tax=Angiostrongylus cantonensis TaxID=6313 RepID=A0A158P5Q6_ANGCA